MQCSSITSHLVAFANNHSFFFCTAPGYWLQQHSPSLKLQNQNTITFTTTTTPTTTDGAVLFFFPVGQSSAPCYCTPLRLKHLRFTSHVSQIGLLLRMGGEKITKFVTLFGWFDANDDAPYTHTFTHTKHTVAILMILLLLLLLLLQLAIFK